MVYKKILFELFILIILIKSSVYARVLSSTDVDVQNCINQDIGKRPVIIDTDTDIDDLWAIQYALNVPTINVLAITTVGNGYSTPFYSGSNVLSFLDLIGCSSGVGVGYGLNLPLLSSGYVIPTTLLGAIDTYVTAPSCLNQTVNIFLQPSPYSGIELIKLILKYSKVPVDILVLGPMTNIAQAISEDRSIVSNIGTLYFSGGQFKPITSYPNLVPNLTAFYYPYGGETPDSSPNAYLDILAVQRVGRSGIKNLVAMPLSTQNTMPVNLTELNSTLTRLNITLKPFVYNFISSLARCTNASEDDMKWWDNSAAQLMIQLQTNNSQGFCQRLEKVQSIYVLSADAHQFYGQGMTDGTSSLTIHDELVNYTICTQSNADIFLKEFLTKINSEKLYSCQKNFNQRFDIKLQQCLNTYDINSYQQTQNIANKKHLNIYFSFIFLFYFLF